MKAKITIIMLVVLLVALPAGAQGGLTVEAARHAKSSCSTGFITHELDHITTAAEPIRMFDGNGSGLAINDLNNDGLLDIVLANLAGPETILWNEGNLQFRAQQLDTPVRTRAVSIIDLDADGWRDIVFTSQRAAPSLWRNQGGGTFAFTGMPGVSHPAYAMSWGDLDGDSDLDLVTGSYDAELSLIMTNETLFEGGTGVYVYENQDGVFAETQLSENAQALTILLLDLTADGRWEIAVGNDFGELDGYWTLQESGWEAFMPFGTITHSTMSFDAADLDNNGAQEMFATDMHPYSEDEATMSAWQPVMEAMMAMPMHEGDPQVMSNTLQTMVDGEFLNVSDVQGIAASGWSWSSKFGDLNSDGFVDLYIVNGMIAEDLFGHLPNNELIEENQVFRNVDGAAFVSAPEWNLNTTASGRGMSMADLDGDGDLDIVVNNLRSAAMLFENQLCSGANLTVTLRQPGVRNPDAIGARLVLHTAGSSYQRDIRANSGYLSGDPTQVHFGLPTASEIAYLEIIWPDGTVDQVDNIEANVHLTITRD